ncbi:alpha/beta fold hydrolase [Rhizobium leguminosarum]|uniref:alpha/beta fold hydrolase n=1 Tax=Rhizobium leguminosarum TaxID=384 RepID=UPI001AE71F0D|nr:alpha/beta hydrolase [Rhizobium leguminosarum]MBP2448354.1 pimeloyl-ACP methyl ester carboxylesterase [Rhizobium leguminosarum]
MLSIETGKFLERIPFAKVGTDPDPILVINGGQGFMMAPDDARISKDARRLARVLPGDRSFVLFGYDPDATEVSVDDLANDVSKVIDQHLGGRADVVGISYGGVVASHLAVRSPQNINKLVLMSSAPWFSVEGKRRLRRQIDLIHAGELNLLLREFTTMFRRPWLNLLVGLRVRLGGNRMVQRLGKLEVVLRYLEAMLKSELAVDGSTFQGIPTLVIVGSRDPFFAEAVVEAGIRAPNLQTSMFEGETHMVPVERDKAVKQIVSTFLGSR